MMIGAVKSSSRLSPLRFNFMNTLIRTTAEMINWTDKFEIILEFVTTDASEIDITTYTISNLEIRIR